VNLRPVLALLLVATVAACGGGDKKSSATPTPDAKTAITTAWESFFNPAGTVDAHVALLQNGAAFRTELAAAQQDPAAKNLSAKVKTVVVTGTTAAVTYDLLGAAGAVLLPGAQGQAVEENGHWLVSKATYCQLISLQNPAAKHPGCA
jgi:hypothetical protein